MQLPRVGLYLLSFGLARGGAFVAPIILANLLTPSHYGTLEFVQAVASMGATLFAFGTVGVVPLVLVRHTELLSWAAVLLHQMLCAVFLVGLAALCFMWVNSPLIWLSALAVSALMLQALWSVTLKSMGRGEASLVLEAGFWGSLALAASAAFGWGVPESSRWHWVLAALLAYLAGLTAWTLLRLIRTRPRDASWLYAPTMRAGAPLMIASLLSMLAVTSGRIGIGLLATPELTADYAVLFRATALPIVAHQLLVVARFRRVFELPARDLERLLPVIVGLVTACVVAFWLLADFFGLLLGPAFVSSFHRNHAEGLLILTQCILWSAVALNDLVNTRTQLAGVVARATGAYFVLTLPLAWWFLSSQSVTLSLYVPVHSFIMAGYFLTQAVVMWRCGIHLMRTWGLALGTFVGLSVLTQLI